MRRRRRFGLGVVFLMVVLTLAACNKGRAEVKEVDKLLEDAETKIDYSSIETLHLGPGTKISVVLKESKNNYWNEVAAGIQKAVDDFNEMLEYKGSDKIQVVFDSPSIGKDVEQQIYIIDTVLAENPDILCLAVIDMDSCTAQVEAAKENGIPIIFIDSAVESEDIEVVCATDNYKAGREAAMKLAEGIQNRGEVAILAHISITETSKSRLNGFQDEIEENYPDIEIVKISYDESRELDVDLVGIASEVMKEYPSLKGYFSTNETMTAAMLEASKNNEGEIVLVGFDSGEALQEAVRDGSLYGFIAQNPYAMGYVSVVAGARAFLNRENDSVINTGHIWVNQQNIDEEEIQKYLYK
jgi:ABC-type sugar transport system, periplasmic component